VEGIFFWSELGQWIVLGLLGLMLFGLISVLADLRRRVGQGIGALVPNDGLAIGAAAPALEGRDARNGAHEVVMSAGDRATMVAFLSPSCRPCVELVPHLNRVAAREKDLRVIAVVQPGDGFDYPRELSAKIAVIGDVDGDLTQSYEVKRTPLVYVISAEGNVLARTVPNTLLELDNTLDGLVTRQGGMPWVSVGSSEEH